MCLSGIQPPYSLGGIAEIVLSLIIIISLFLPFAYIAYAKLLSKSRTISRKALGVSVLIAMLLLLISGTLKWSIRSTIPCLNLPESFLEVATSVSTEQVWENPEDLLDEELLVRIKDLFEESEISLEDLYIGVIKEDNREGETIVVVGQLYKGVPIFGSSMNYVINQKDQVSLRAGYRYRNIDIDIQPKISLSDAVGYADKEYEILHTDMAGNLTVYEGHITVYDLYLGSDQRGEEYTLAWYISPKDGGWPYVIVDAYSGDVLFYDDGIRF